jgi:hypothetical protein
VIPIPESVSYYWADPINMAAVDVLSKSVVVPADLGLDEAERFELAGLAADRVRVDFSCFLRRLWSATWGAAVREALPAARLATYGGHQSFTTAIDPLADPSMGQIWASGGIPGIFTLPDRRQLFTRLNLLDRNREIGLQFYLVEIDGSYSTSDSLDLGDVWSDDGDHCRITRPRLLPVESESGQIDISGASAVARGALLVLAEAL